MRTTRKYIVEEKVCGTCTHYRQHYVQGVDGRFQALWYGHCYNPYARYPLPDGVCPKWQGVEKDGEPPCKKEPVSAG